MKSTSWQIIKSPYRVTARASVAVFACCHQQLLALQLMARAVRLDLWR